jgi:cobalt-zinc-cadmium efflux system membrane fusion protein
VLPRAFQPNELQAVFRDVLSEPAPAAPPARASLVRRGILAALWSIIVGAALLLVLPMLHVPGVPNLLKMFVGRAAPPDTTPATPITLLPGKDTFLLDEDTYRALKIPPPYKVQSEPARRQIILSGSLAFDPDWLGRIQSRFPGEVEEIGNSREKQLDPETGKSIPIPLRYGSQVRKGDVMAVVWSKDLGEKKSDLIDALVKMHLDEKNLSHLRNLLAKGAATEAQVRAARNAVSADLSAVARIRRTLQTWKVGSDELDEIEKEAKRISDGTSRKKPQMRNPARKMKLAYIHLRAPFDGVVVEKNVARGDIVAGDTDLFTIADLRTLTAIVNVPREELPSLRRLQKHHAPRPIPWQVRLTTDREGKPLPSKGLERLDFALDGPRSGIPAAGQVANPAGTLRAGQAITATVLVPAISGEVAVPASALVEVSGAHFVFVQPDPKKLVFSPRRVVVVRRSRDVAHLRTTITPQQKQAGVRELRPGERVVTAGALELQAALDDLRGEQPLP